MRGRVELTNRHGLHHRLHGVFVHQLDDVFDHHVTSVDGLPVTTLARTIVDLAAVCSVGRLAHALDDANDRLRTPYLDVGVTLRDVARRGKPGVRKLGRLLTDRCGTRGVARSVLERAFIAALDEGRIELPVLQYSFPGRALPTFCVDFAYPAEQLVFETDGRTWHARIAAIKNDAERDLEAARRGWQVVRLLYEHVLGDPTGTARDVAEIRATRAAQLA